MPFSARKFSRRALVAGGAAVAGSVSGGQRGGARVLALVGDRFHNPDYIRVALTRIFEGLVAGVDYTFDYGQLSRKSLESYQLFVCLRDGMIWPGGYLGPDAYTAYAQYLEYPATGDAKPERWITAEQAAALKEFVEAGNGFYALHNSSDVSTSSPVYRGVMGGVYIGHPPLRPFKVRVVNRDHPITQGVGDFFVNDEQHYVHYDKDRAHVLLEAENVDGLTYQNLGAKSIAGWAYDYGRGRVVFTSPGHTIHALWQPEYAKLQKRAIRWLLKEI